MRPKEQKRKKFVAVMNIPSPYRLHLLGELARQLNERDMDFHCHFMARGHKERPKSWLNPKIDFPHTYWRDFGCWHHHFNPGLILHTMCSFSDFLLCGSSFDTFTGIGVQLLGRSRVKLCWLEGNTKAPGQLGGIKGWIKRLVMGRCRFAPVPGQEGAGYVALHQSRTNRPMPKPVCLPNLVDETRFVTKAALDAEALDALRRRLFGEANNRICLIPARFDPVKGLKEFFTVLEPSWLKGWKLVIMGDGDEEQETLTIVKRRGLDDFVKVIHSVPYDEMPKYYQAADLMLLPSRQDMNPLCVVEALHAGLPIALSDRAGNVAEAVVDGDNGWVLHVTDSARYAEELSVVFKTTRDELLKMGRRSKEARAPFWDTNKSVEKFLNRILPEAVR